VASWSPRRPDNPPPRLSAGRQLGSLGGCGIVWTGSGVGPPNGIAAGMRESSGAIVADGIGTGAGIGMTMAGASGTCKAGLAIGGIFKVSGGDEPTSPTP
jgi:hypothetical protein